MKKILIFLTCITLLTAIVPNCGASAPTTTTYTFKDEELRPDSFIIALYNLTEKNVALIKWAIGKDPQFRHGKWIDPDTKVEYTPLTYLYAAYPAANEQTKQYCEELVNFLYERGTDCSLIDFAAMGDEKNLGKAVRDIWVKAAQAIQAKDSKVLDQVLKDHPYLPWYTQPQTNTTLLHQAVDLFVKDDAASEETFKVLMRHGANYLIEDPTSGETVLDIMNKNGGHAAKDIFEELLKVWVDAFKAVVESDIDAIDTLLTDHDYLLSVVDPGRRSTLLHEAAQRVQATYDDSVVKTKLAKKANSKNAVKKSPEAVEAEEAQRAYAEATQMFAHLMRKGADCTLLDEKGDSVSTCMEDTTHPAAYLFKAEKEAREKPSLSEYGKKAGDKIVDSATSIFEKLKPHKYKIGAGLVALWVVKRLFTGSSKKVQHDASLEAAGQTV